MFQRTAEESQALAQELRDVIDQAEALLEALDQDKDAAVGELRLRVNQRLEAARERLRALDLDAADVMGRAADAADAYIRENPWTSVAIGASVGLIIGAFLVSLTGPRED